MQYRRSSLLCNVASKCNVVSSSAVFDLLILNLQASTSLFIRPSVEAPLQANNFSHSISQSAYQKLYIMETVVWTYQLLSRYPLSYISLPYPQPHPQFQSQSPSRLTTMIKNQAALVQFSNPFSSVPECLQVSNACLIKQSVLYTGLFAIKVYTFWQL